MGKGIDDEEITTATQKYSRGAEEAKQAKTDPREEASRKDTIARLGLI